MAVPSGRLGSVQVTVTFAVDSTARRIDTTRLAAPPPGLVTEGVPAGDVAVHSAVAGSIVNSAATVIVWPAVPCLVVSVRPRICTGVVQSTSRRALRVRAPLPVPKTTVRSAVPSVVHSSATRLAWR